MKIPDCHQSCIDDERLTLMSVSIKYRTGEGETELQTKTNELLITLAR